MKVNLNFDFEKHVITILDSSVDVNELRRWLMSIMVDIDNWKIITGPVIEYYPSPIPWETYPTITYTK